MDPKKLNDKQLDCEAISLAKQEREILAKVLQHLREIERRKLYSALRYRSLFDYATRRLGYSEDQAYQRIAAMRVVREIPEIERKIETGALTLSHITVAARLIRSEEISKNEKLELFSKMENTSKREAEKIALAQSSAEILPVEIIKLVSCKDIEIRFTANLKLQEKIEKLKCLLAHSHPGISLAELVEYSFDLALGKLDPAKPRMKDRTQAEGQRAKRLNSNSSVPERAEVRQKIERPQNSAVQNFAQRTYISSQIRREVWRRDGNKCTRCRSHYALEIDHIEPIGFGGTNDLNNLRLLCRSCNQRSAIQNFGLKKIESSRSRPAEDRK